MAWTRTNGFSQNAQFSGASVASTAVTLPSSVSVGDTILVTTSAGNDVHAAASTMTDNLGGGSPNVYARVTVGQGGALYDSGQDQSSDLWWCIVTQAGTPTITYTPDSVNRPWLAIKGSYFTGSDASSTRRASNGAKQVNPGTATDAISSSSMAAQSGDLLYGFTNQVSSAVVHGTGFTAAAQDSTSGLIDEWLTASGSAAVTFTDGTNGGGERPQTIGIAITPATPAPTIALTGTITSANDISIRTGGNTIVLTITGDTWVASGATFNAQRQNIINGLTAGSSPTHGWNNEVKAKIGVADVVRTSATVVTITLDAEAGYSIASNETITATVPGSALSGGNPIVASPTFSVNSSGPIKISQSRMDMTGVPFRNASTILFNTPGASTVSGTIFTITANEVQALGDAVRINSSAKATLAKADVIADSSDIFLATTATTSSNPFSYLAHGVVKFGSSQGWTAGGLVYLSTTGTTTNTLTQTPPSSSNNVVQALGVALANDTLYFNPSLVQVEIN